MNAKLKCMVFPRGGLMAMGQPFPTIYVQTSDSEPVMFQVGESDLEILDKENGFFRIALLNVEILDWVNDYHILISPLGKAHTQQFKVGKKLLEQIEEDGYYDDAY